MEKLIINYLQQPYAKYDYSNPLKKVDRRIRLNIKNREIPDSKFIFFFSPGMEVMLPGPILIQSIQIKILQ